MATTSTKAATKSRAKQSNKPERRPVMLNGKPAKNRHFLLDQGLYKKAADRCRKDGIAISDVLRHGIAEYGASAPAKNEVKPALDLLPKETLKDLKRVWANSELATHYVAALHRAGWTTRTIADSIVASGAAEKMTRQAVSLRVLKAPEELFADIPPVPELGPRRAIVSVRKGQKGEYKPAKKNARDAAHDLSFRIADEDYELAARRAKHEGAMMSGVLDSILVAYTNGEYDNVDWHGTEDDDS